MVAPKLQGGGLPPFAGAGGQPLPLHGRRLRHVGEDLWVTGMVR